MRLQRKRSVWLSMMVAGATAVATTGFIGAAAGADTSTPTPLRITAGADTAGKAPASQSGLSGQAVAARSAAITTTVRLISGEAVSVSTSSTGQQSLEPAIYGAATRASLSSMIHFTIGADLYAVPVEDVPYLGSTLDPRLFDVSYLARAKLGTTGHDSLPVRVTGTTSSHPSVPGLSSTAATGAQMMNLTEATAFGRLLGQRWAAARATGTNPTLPGGQRITLARTTGGPALPRLGQQSSAAPKQTSAGPAYQKLTMKFIGTDGKPGTALGLVQNVDSSKYPLNVIDPNMLCGSLVCPGVHGSFSMLVPDGTYSLSATILTPDGGAARPSSLSSALVVQPQVRVKGDTTVTFDARKAHPYSMTVPGTVPTFGVDSIDFARTAADGGGLDTSAGFITLGQTMGMWKIYGFPAYAQIAPVDSLAAASTQPVSVGTMNFWATSLFTTQKDLNTPSPDGHYTMVFPNAGGIPASLTYSVPKANLTTVHQAIYDNANLDAAGASNNLRLSIPLVYLAWGSRVVGNYMWQGVPAGPSTEYWYSGNSALTRWSHRVRLAYAGAFIETAPQAIHSGQQIAETFGEGPIAPASAAVPDTAIEGFYTTFASMARRACVACRQDNNGALNLAQGLDSNPSHASYGGSQLTFGSFRNVWSFYRNGKLALQATNNVANPTPFGVFLPMHAGSGVYRLDWSLSDTMDLMQSETSWTFHSSPSDPGHKLPATLPCMPDPDRGCSFLPFLFVEYHLPGLNYSNQEQAGSSSHITFSVTPQQYAPAPKNVRATVAVSFDDGATWSNPVAATALGDGSFDAPITNPSLSSSSGYVSIRVTATDAAGNSVTQTNVRAYGLHE